MFVQKWGRYNNEGNCITDLLTVKSSPRIEAVAYVDALSDAIICLAQTEQSAAEATNGTNGTNGTEATMGEACLPDLERLKDPDMPFAEAADIISKSIVCSART